MKYKGVEGGTKSGEIICNTCSHARIIKGKAEAQQKTYCTYGGIQDKELPFEVLECSKYDDIRIASLFELNKIAWIINSDGGKNKVGFVKPGTTEHYKLISE